MRLPFNGALVVLSGVREGNFTLSPQALGVSLPVDSQLEGGKSWLSLACL